MSLRSQPTETLIYLVTLFQRAIDTFQLYLSGDMCASYPAFMKDRARHGEDIKEKSADVSSSATRNNPTETAQITNHSVSLVPLMSPASTIKSLPIPYIITFLYATYLTPNYVLIGQSYVCHAISTGVQP